MAVFLTCDFSHGVGGIKAWCILNMKRKERENQCQAIRLEFEHDGPIQLKNPLGAGWGLLPILRWVDCLIMM